MNIPTSRHRIARLTLDTQGASAVEFALIAPVFLLLACGILCFGIVFATYNGVQQLAAEAARASVGGLDVSERDQLARTYVTNNVAAYGLLDPARLTVATVAQTTSFQVAVTYDMSASPVFQLARIVPMPSSQIRRAATVQNGGY